MSDAMISVRPPFTEELLQSSQRLSASEIAIAGQFISAGEHCLSYFNAAIARSSPGVELDELTQQREDITQQVLQYKNAIRCIRRLPPEIISKFLAFTLPYVEPDSFGETPWHLGHICRYWRDVALASSSLWTDIVIMHSHTYPAEILQTLLLRSSNSPIKVQFWASRATPRVTELLQTLVGCAHRWTNASIFIRPVHWPLLAPLRGRIPLLRYLQIDVSDDRDFMQNPASTELGDPFEIAPALHSVTVEDLSGLPHTLVLPFQQLTYIKLVGGCNDIKTILSTTPNVDAASLDLTEVPPDASFPCIRLPHLRRLYISAQSFLDHFELPMLEEIYTVDSHPAPLLSLIERCPTIRLKTLRLAWCTPAHISQILEACPTVQTLGIQIMASDGIHGGDLLSKLTVRHTGGTTYTAVGPNLHSIELGLDHANINYELFVDMVESRWRVPAEGSPCCRLRSVELLHVDGKNVLDSSMGQKLDVLKGEGLRVSLLEGSEATSELMDWRI